MLLSFISFVELKITENILNAIKPKNKNAQEHFSSSTKRKSMRNYHSKSALFPEAKPLLVMNSTHVHEKTSSFTKENNISQV